MKHGNWVMLALAIIAISVGLLFQSAAVSGMQQFEFQNNRVLGDMVYTSTLIGVGAFVLSGIILVRTQRALLFTDEVVNELMQVAWPTRDETIRASTTVILTTFFTAAVLAVYDFFWQGLAGYIL